MGAACVESHFFVPLAMPRSKSERMAGSSEAAWARSDSRMGHQSSCSGVSFFLVFGWDFLGGLEAIDCVHASGQTVAARIVATAQNLNTYLHPRTLPILA